MLPRINTETRLDEGEDEDVLALAPRYLPRPVVELIVDFYIQFERVRLKQFHYGIFMESYKLSLHRSASRLKLFNREFKAMAMSHRSQGATCDLMAWIRNAKLCKRTFDYEKLKRINQI